MLIDASVVAATAGTIAAVTTPALAYCGLNLRSVRRRLADHDKASSDALARARAEADETLARHKQDTAGQIQQLQRAVEVAGGQVRASSRGWEMLGAEIEHLLHVRIPAMVSRVRHPYVVVPGLLQQQYVGTDVDRWHADVLTALESALCEEGQRVDEAAQAVVRATMSGAQVLTYRAQDLVETLVKQYGDDAYPGLADDLLQVDHLLEQQVHRSQITALAVGAVFSLTRNDTYLIDLVMSAIGRVPEFRRRIGEPAVHLNRRIGVAARAAEPVASITAELLTNAVHHSHGTLPVSVAVHETDTGAAVVIEDAGVGLNADQLEQAARLLGGEIPVRLVGLGDPPHTGWAAIGRIVRQYGIQVGLRTSRFGGVEATVHVPRTLLVEMPAGTEPSVMAPAPIQRPSAPTLSGPPAGDGELPRRRRVRSSRKKAGPRPGPAPVASPEEARDRWASFQEGSRAGRAAADPAHAEPTGEKDC